MMTPLSAQAMIVPLTPPLALAMIAAQPFSKKQVKIKGMMTVGNMPLVSKMVIVEAMTATMKISQFTANIQRVYDDRLTAFLMYVDRNRTIYLSSAVITTVYLTISTIGDINHHIAIHVSVLRTSIDCFLIIYTLRLNF